MFSAEFAITYTDNDKNYTDDPYGEDNLLNIARKRMPNASVFRQDANGKIRMYTSISRRILNWMTRRRICVIL